MGDQKEKRRNLVYMNFQMDRPSRQMLVKAFENFGVRQERTTRTEYLDQIAESKFVLSPRGT
jgi:hypothetical protein